MAGVAELGLRAGKRGASVLAKTGVRSEADGYLGVFRLEREKGLEPSALCLGSTGRDVCPNRARAQIRFRPDFMSGWQSETRFGRLPVAVPSI